jgi:hypothetical protein
MLVSDAAAIVALGVGAQLRGGKAAAVTLPGLAAYVVVPPVVHLLHGHRDRALGSLLLRLGLPVLGGMMGMPLGGTCNQDDDSCYARGFFLGFMIGLGGAAAIDQVMAFDRVEPPARAHGLVVAPTLAIGRGGGSLGLAGAF